MDVGASKAVLLQRVADKLDEMDKNGCGYGKVLKEKVSGNKEDLTEIKDALKWTNRQMFATMISVITTFAILLIRYFQ